MSVDSDHFLQQEFGLQDIERLDEQQLIDLLADRILVLLEQQPAYIFSLLYRMDVSESQVAAVMLPSAALPANVGLATLIIARQKERQRTRARYREDGQEPIW